MSYPKPLFKIFYRLHIYIGIFIAFHLAVFSLSGLALLFKDDIQGHPISSKQEIIANREQFAQKYNQALTNLLHMYPNDRPLDLYPDERNTQVIKGRLGIEGSTKLRGARRVALDFNSGEPIAQQTTSSSSRFFDNMLALHRDFFMGAKGQLYIGFVGIGYVFMLLSGFLIYGKFMKGRPFGDVQKTPVLKLTDLHKFAGIVTFGWSLLIAISGTLLAFNPVFMKNFQDSNLKHLTQQYQSFQNQDAAVGRAPFKDVLDTALRNKPDSVISYIVFPGMERGIPGHYLVLVHGITPLTQQISEYLVIDANTSKLVEVLPLSLSVTSALVSRPLHFGNYGGISLKIVWLFFTIGSLAVALFGVFSFFMRRVKNKTKETHILFAHPPKEENKQIQKPSKQYSIPFILLTITILGILIPLFASNTLGQIGVFLLLVPLAVLVFFKRKRNA